MDLETAQNIIRETRTAYNKIFKHFSQTREYLWEEFKDLKKYFNPQEKILDFGCGNGRFYELIRDLNPDYYGVDLSLNLLNLAQERIPQGHFFEIDEKLNLSFKDNFFDKIVCLATLHHIPSRELQLHLLKEFYRVLKPEGFLILTVWDFYHGKNRRHLLKNYFYGIISFIRKKKSFLGFKDLYLPWKNNQGQIVTERYFHIFSKNELIQLLKEVGFQVVSFKLDPHNNKKEYYNLLVIAQKSNQNNKTY